jgi:general stress protein YciG
MAATHTTSPQSPVPPLTQAPDKTSQPVARVSEKARRGFASMDPALQRRIASEGGKASHMSGRGHQWTAAEASAAGRKGGTISRRPANSKALNK